ncbi:MAG: hypothetical protein IPK13_21065 [Deltaproteobacteria bacterium]|nr:hypothetical protein [Deltaproteobacteria bacterium]
MRANAIEDEVRALREGAGVCRREERAVLRLLGADRVRFLNGMVTNDVSTLTPGQGLVAIKTTQKGRIEGVLRVRALEDAFEIDVEGSVKNRILSSFDRLIIMDDCSIAEHPDAFAVISVLGPRGDAVLEAAGYKHRPASSYAFVQAPDGVVIVRDDSLGVVGYDLHIPQTTQASQASQASQRTEATQATSSSEQTLETALGTVSRGAPKPDELLARVVASGGHRVSTDALNVLRVEAGRPRDGVDLEEDTLPMEARLEDAISMTKGCYVGQEVIARATNLGGIKHILVGLRFGPASKSIPERGAILRMASDGRETGHLTSAVFSFALNEVIALGYVRKADDAPGTRLLVETGDGSQVEATLSPLPFLPPASAL